jgi:hypothetical protein
MVLACVVFAGCGTWKATNVHAISPHDLVRVEMPGNTIVLRDVRVCATSVRTFIAGTVTQGTHAIVDVTTDPTPDCACSKPPCVKLSLDETVAIETLKPNWPLIAVSITVGALAAIAIITIDVVAILSSQSFH